VPKLRSEARDCEIVGVQKLSIRIQAKARRCKARIGCAEERGKAKRGSKYDRGKIRQGKAT
jgi:hypothetical protein